MRYKLFLFLAVATITYFVTTYNSASMVTIATPYGVGKLPLISFVIVLFAGFFLIILVDNIVNWVPEKFRYIKNDRLINNLRKKIADLEIGIDNFLQGKDVDNLQLLRDSQKYLQGDLSLKVPDMIFLLGNLLNNQYKPLNPDNDFLFILEMSTAKKVGDYKNLAALLIKKDIHRLYKLYQNSLTNFIVNAIPCLDSDHCYKLLKSCPKGLQHNVQVLSLYLTNLAKHNSLLDYEPKIRRYLDVQEIVALMGLIWPQSRIEEAISYLNKRQYSHPAYDLAKARLFYRTKNYNQAIFYYAKIQDIYVDDSKVCVEIALAYHANGQYDKARYWCENIWER